MTSPLVIAGLYVPGDRPERFAKALATDADQVIIDLEDAVAPGHKDAARASVAEFLAGYDGDRVAVRTNGSGTPWHEADLAMLAGAARVPGLRLPKVQHPDDVSRVVEGFADPPRITCLIESALGIENAYAIASHPRVSAIALGEADLRAELGVTAEAGLDWLRVRSVVAARAAGLDPPNMAVYPGLDDLIGLAESCAHGVTLGLWGRTALHPRQLPVIRRAFTPDAAAVAHAEAVLAALAGSVGAARMSDGRMVDEAMAAEARRTLQLVRPDGDR